MIRRSNAQHIEYVSAVYLTSRNCEHVIGRPWEAVRKIATQAQPPIKPLRHGGVLMFDAAAIIGAIRAQAEPKVPLSERDEAAALLAELGVELR